MDKEIASDFEELEKQRKALADKIRAKVCKLREEQEQLNAEYDGEIDDLFGRLKALGIDQGHEPNPHPVAQKCLQVLKERPGVWIKAGELMAAARTNASMAVVLRSMLDAGIVQADGETRARCYRYPAMNDIQ